MCQPYIVKTWNWLRKWLAIKNQDCSIVEQNAYISFFTCWKLQKGLKLHPWFWLRVLVTVTKYAWCISLCQFWINAIQSKLVLSALPMGYGNLCGSCYVVFSFHQGTWKINNCACYGTHHLEGKKKKEKRKVKTIGKNPRLHDQNALSSSNSTMLKPFQFTVVIFPLIKFPVYGMS